MKKNEIKIGLVSAKKHCKSHMQALQADGYDISLLGARPKSIPSSYDAIIVRVVSVSHEGDATARAWQRKTGKPAIYENGLSGIRRELKRITEGAEESPVGESKVVEESKQKVHDTLQMCADTYVEHRPDDGPDELSKALNALLHENYPDRAQTLGSMIPSIVESVYHTQTHNTQDPMPLNIPYFEYVGTDDKWPVTEPWSQVYSEDKARKAYLEGMDLLKTANHMATSALGYALKHGSFNRRVKRTWSPLLGGKPLMAAFIMYTLHPGIQPREAKQAYKAITDKGADSRLLSVVTHCLGVRSVDGMPETTEPVSESNTNAILDVMEDISTHKREVKVDYDTLRKTVRSQSGSITALESKLDEAIKGGFDPRTDLKLIQMEKRIGDLMRTEVQNFKHEVNRTLGNTVTQNDLSAFKKETRVSIKAKVKVLDDSHRQVLKVLQNFGSESGAEYLAIEDRIKKLEAGIITFPEGEVEERFAQMKEDLRSDISNAFDALAAEQPSGDLSSNPFAALEQVKAALKAAGFKGTLTLTIE